MESVFAFFAGTLPGAHAELSDDVPQFEGGKNVGKLWVSQANIRWTHDA